MTRREAWAWREDVVSDAGVGRIQSGVRMLETSTIQKVGALLDLANKAVYATPSGEPPAFKLRGRWRSKRAELHRWLEARPRGGEVG